jgi:hypothetical protein
MTGMDKRKTADAKRAAHFVDDYLPALLAQASHLISGEFHRVVNAKGFTISEWRVLATLAGGEPMSIGRVAEITVMKQPTVTRVLDRMQAAGHVERLAHDAEPARDAGQHHAVGQQARGGPDPAGATARAPRAGALRRQARGELKATLIQLIELHKDTPKAEGEEA